MNNNKIGIFLILMVVVVVIIVVLDYSSSDIENSNKNAYELNTDEYKEIPDNLIHYKETKQIVVGTDEAKDIVYLNEYIYLLTDKNIKVLAKDGQLQNKIELKEEPFCLYVDSTKYIVGYKDHFEILDLEGTSIIVSQINSDRSIFTSIAATDTAIYIADAGNRKVIIFDYKGQVLSAFDGKSENGDSEFVVPSPFFDLAINKYQGKETGLTVVNPGNHCFQTYNFEGWLQSKVQMENNTLIGFTGCCNPSHFAYIDEKRFITSEKKIVRIKIYRKPDILESVVAGPDQFKDGGLAPEVVVDEEGTVIALDFDKQLIRFFEKK